MIKWIPKEKSKIAIVGDFPTEQDSRTKIPFSGPEGRYLSRLLNAVKIDKSQCYLTNVVHKPAPKGQYFLFGADTLERGKEQLKNDLQTWNPNIVIALGPEALTVLADKKGIFKYRGYVMDSTLIPGMKIFPTIHPGGLIRGNPQYEPVVINDLAQAKEESEYSEIQYPEQDVEVVENINDAISLLKSLTNISDPVACDIETAGFNKIMTAYGIAISKHKAYSITKEALKSPSVLRALSIFCDSNTPKIFHNACFDALHNSIYYNIFNRNIFYDTMLAQHAIFPVLPKSLAFCASLYTKNVYWKDEGKDSFTQLKEGKQIDWDSLYIYNGKDCCLTYEVYEEQKTQLDYWGTYKVFQEMMKLIYPCLRAMHFGLNVHQEAVTTFAEENEKVLETLNRIKLKTIGDVNLNSPKQKKELLYEIWKLPVQKKQGKISTDKHSLEKLERFPTPQKPALGLIRTIMNYNKRRDFYRLKIDLDKRIRCALKIHGTYTGRMSSSASITGSGQNMQNIPKKARAFYIPDPGKVFIQMDLSQSEARIVAALCQDKDWLNEFDYEDLHTKVASMLYNIPPDKVRKEIERMTAKRVAHASHYLLGWDLLSKILKCSAKEAKKHKKTYFEIRPKLLDWHEEVKKKIRASKKIVTPFNRVIQFPGPISDEVIRAAVASEPQSTSADYLNNGINKMYYSGPEDFEFLLQVHDSILFQVPDNLEAIKRNIFAMKELTEITINVRDIPLLIPTEFELGYDWFNMTEIKDLNNINSYYDKICNTVNS